MASRQQRYIPHVREVFEPPETVNGNHHVNRSVFDDDVTRSRYPELTTTSRNQSTDGRVQNRIDHRQYDNYGRTLTEKDVKHIERHLSMKKTIRKQLSRHLTQSYLDAESKCDDDSRNDKNSTTVSNAFAKSESNFLELLKSVRSDDNDHRDSGHSYNCNPTQDIDLMQSQWSRNFGTKNNNNGVVVTSSEPKKSSFWKKLTVRAKIKH